jgi:oxygen-independent coproporphyrinogen-3 oxidase
MPRPFQVYVHVPFCARRCGYCDFNTYVSGPDVQRAFVDDAVKEMKLAAAELSRLEEGGRAARTVFFGGGTPTLLPLADLTKLVEGVRRHFGLSPGAEVTAEANPDTVDRSYLDGLAQAGFTRLSIGMQSAVPAVLAALDRTHDPARVADTVKAAQRAGLEASVDLIYGTPGESLKDWEASVRAAIDLGVDHVSAYALTLEPHTPMARRIHRGELGQIDPDEQADKYELADELFQAAGLAWYEISNWARPGHESLHNLGYWTGADWWGIGPGAHSALGANRFWNVKSPRAYGERLARAELPIAGRERLGQAELAVERVMLRLRTASGLKLADLSAAARLAVPTLVADGLASVAGGAVTGPYGVGDGIVLTRRGRLLGDLVTRSLLTSS